MTVLPAGPAPGALAPSRYRSPIQYDEVAAEVPVGVVVPFDFALDWEYWRWLPAGLRKMLGRVHPAMGQSAGCGSGGGGGCSSCGGCSSSAAPRATVHAAEGQERF